MMLSRSAVCRAARQVSQQQRRSLAAPASGSFQYENGEAAGIKFASRDRPGPVSSIALVSQAGTRFETAPGLTEGLKWYAFKVRQIVLDQDGKRCVLMLTGCYCATGHRKAFDSPDTARSRVTRRLSQCLPYPREPDPQRQVPQGRSTLLRRAARRGCHDDKIYT